MQICVVYAPRVGKVEEWNGQLREGACVADAIAASGMAQHLDVQGQALQTQPVGIWGKVVAWSQPLHDGDRVEIYRPLTVDPKIARRERFRQQGSRSAGLFKKKG